MKTTENLTILEELASYVEACDWEVRSRLDVISYMLTNNMPTTTDAFKQYQVELTEAKKKFDIAKATVESEIVQPWLNDHKITNGTWTLDYQTKTLHLEYEA